MIRRNFLKRFFEFLSLAAISPLRALGKNKASIKVRKSGERGISKHGWLISRHTFSFASYQDPKHMGFRNLKVINQDIVKPLQGFPTHGHRDMEIISYVLNGQLKHEDSKGNITYIKAGDIQRMTAGTGIFHSEYNASRLEDVHFLQIWLLPSKKNLAPGYDQKYIDQSDMRNELSLLAGPDKGAIRLNSNAYLYSSRLDKDKKCLAKSRLNSRFWVQVLEGELAIQNTILEKGDGAAVENIELFEIAAKKDSHFILFDLA